MDAPDHYQTTYVSKTKIVVFYSLTNSLREIKIAQVSIFHIRFESAMENFLSKSIVLETDESLPNYGI